MEEIIIRKILAGGNKPFLTDSAMSAQLISTITFPEEQPGLLGLSCDLCDFYVVSRKPDTRELTLGGPVSTITAPQRCDVSKREVS